MIITIFLLFEFLNNLTCFIINDFFLEISFYNVNLTIFKNINFQKRLNKTLNVIIYKKFIFISHIKFSIYIKHIIKDRLFVNYKFENVKFINIIRKKSKKNENSH